MGPANVIACTTRKHLWSKCLFIYVLSHNVFLCELLSFMRCWGWIVQSKMGNFIFFACHHVSKLLLGAVMILCIFLSIAQSRSSHQYECGNRGYRNKTRTQPSSAYNCFNGYVQNRRVSVPWPCHLGSSVLGTICSVLRLVHFLFSSS